MLRRQHRPDSQPGRAETLIQEVFGRLTRDEVVERLTQAQTAYGAINSVQDLIAHPQLRARRMPVHGQMFEVLASPYRMEWDAAEFVAAPEIGEHGQLTSVPALTEDV